MFVPQQNIGPPYFGNFSMKSLVFRDTFHYKYFISKTAGGIVVVDIEHSSQKQHVFVYSSSSEK